MLGTSLLFRFLTVIAFLFGYWAWKPIFGLWVFRAKHYDPIWLLVVMVLFFLFAEKLSDLFLKLDAWLEVKSQKYIDFWEKLPSLQLRNLMLWFVAFYGIASFLIAYPAKRFYGDAGAVVGFLEYGVVLHKREPLSPALFYYVHEWIGKAYHWPSIKTIQITTSVAGAIAILGLWHFCLTLTRKLKTDFTSGPLLKIFALIFLCSASTSELWFGYVENYTVPNMFGIWVIALIYRSPQQLSIPLFLLSLTLSFHLSFTTFLPAIALLLWALPLNNNGKIKQALFLVVPLLTLWLIMQKVGYLRSEESGFGGGDGSAFVPWKDEDRTKYTPYLFLSKDHFIAIFNQQKLIAPTALILIFVLFPLWLKEQFWPMITRLPIINSSENPIDSSSSLNLLSLALIAICSFGLTVIWNPDLGPIMDWDLFAGSGIHLNLLALALIFRYFHQAPIQYTSILIMGILINLSQSLNFILQNRGF